MSTRDRLADGYQPDHDIDQRYGRQGELYVADIIDSLRDGASIEVKRDGVFQVTGRLFFETECWSNRTKRYEPSGINRPAAVWAHVMGDARSALFIETALLREICADVAVRHPECCIPNRRGSHPTRGVVVRAEWLWAYLRRDTPPSNGHRLYADVRSDEPKGQR